MYNEHFGLQRAPFRITPDTKLFYPGGSRGEVLEALIYAISSGEGIVKVVGEVGSGKTMLCRMLEERLAEKADIVYIANPSLSPEDTLHAIAMEMKLDVGPEANRLQVMHVLQERLLEKHASNRQVVVFIEEAQSMPIATLEEVRLLSNLETSRDKLLQIVLFGQPELDENLEQPEIRQLKERITHSFYLQPFTPEQMREYVNFRMRAVGYRGPDIFRSGAYRRMAKASAGLTRRINILADKALLAAFAEDTFDVANRHVKIAINDSQFVHGRRWGLPEISLVSGLVLIAAALAWTFIERSDAVGEQLRRWIPIDASQHLSQPAAGGTLPVEDTAAVTVPETAAGSSLPVEDTAAAKVLEPAADDPRATAVETLVSPADDADADSTMLVALASESDASVEVADPTADEPPVPMSDYGIPMPSIKPRSLVPVARGGSHLVLSDSLRNPPRSEARTLLPATRAASESLAPGEATGIPDIDATVSGGVMAVATGEAWVSLGSDLGPLTEARLAATRAWLASADHEHFSIQLLLTEFGRRAHLEYFLRERQAAGEVDDYYVFETRIRSNIWYGVLYKEYATFDAAKAALDELPEEFHYHQPFIRNVRDIATLG